MSARTTGYRRAGKRALMLMALGAGIGWLGSSWPPAWSPWGQSRIAPYLLTVSPAPDPDREIAFYRERVQQDPQGFLNLVALADAYLARARASNEPGWYLLAERTAQRSLANFAPNPGALLVLAQIALARHDFGAAEGLLERAAALAPANLSVVAQLLTIRLARGQAHLAEPYAEALVRRAPGLEAYSQRALVRAALGRRHEAEADFRHALALEQAGQLAASLQTRAWLGRLYAQSGQPEAAEDLYREVLRLRPLHALTLGLLADLELRRGEIRAAEGHYRDAWIESRAPVYLLGRARANLAQGDPDQAEQLWQAAEAQLRQDLAANGFGHRRDLARLLLERGRPGEQAEAFSLMQAEHALRQDPETLNLLAWSLASQGRLAEARALLADSQDPVLLYRAAELAQALGQRAQAAALSARALALDPLLAHDPAFGHVGVAAGGSPHV